MYACSFAYIFLLLHLFIFYTIAKSAYINFAFVCVPGVLDPRNKTGMVSGKTSPQNNCY